MKRKTVSLLLLLVILASTLSIAVAYQYHFVSEKKQISAGLVIKPSSVVVTATLSINPDELNLKSQGRWITAYIQLPEGYDAEDINATTILLNETISPILDPKYQFVSNSSEYLVDHNEDGILERLVKLDRVVVELFIYNQGITYGEVALTITGNLTDGTPFEGIEIISVNYAGDANNDGIINILDVEVSSSQWGLGSSSYNSTCDFNQDGIVDIFDIGILNVNWEQTTPTP